MSFIFFSESIIKFIYYSSMSKTPAPSNIIYKLAKNPIIQIISIVVIPLLAIIVQ